MDFAATLRTAIPGRLLGLQEIAAELARRGTPVSTSSLSAWQRGVSRPSRETSLAALANLEEILGLRAGSLSGGLTPRPRRPRARPAGYPPAEKVWNASDRVARLLRRLGAVPDDLNRPQWIAQRLSVSRDARGEANELTLNRVVRGGARAEERMLFVGQQDRLTHPPRVVHTSGCSLNRFRADPASGFVCFEFRLDPPVPPRGLTVLEFTLRFPPGEAQQVDDVRLPRGTRELVLQAIFHPDRLPEDCWAFFTPAADQPEERREDLSRGVGRTYTHVLLDPPAGIHGLRWTWPDA